MLPCYAKNMSYFQSKYHQLPGTSYQEVINAAYYHHQKLQRRNPRRRVYVRSKYFKRDKVFLTLFWPHLLQKRKGEQIRRAKLYLCALDLLRNYQDLDGAVIDRSHPESVLLRFKGRTKDGVLFIVQVKYQIRSDRRDFISVYPTNNQDKKIRSPAGWP